ncbi:hypothetical protein BMS3Abin17_00240 [archaeon BMS3Abin17]|nr:hypothetical protein BMS3Abin17_00240 [archaeon BMS3Abin17]
MKISPCDTKVFDKGKSIVALDAGSKAAEKWVRLVAKKITLT